MKKREVDIPETGLPSDDRAANRTDGSVPLGHSSDAPPKASRSRAATNDAQDRQRALLIIASILCFVLLVVLIGNTVLRPVLVQQRERELRRITADQLDMIGDMVEERFRSTGRVTTGMSELLTDDRLETSNGDDLWGTPFVLVVNTDASGDGYSLSVRSAGPDREFDTLDDLVVTRPLVAGDSAPADM